MMTTNPIYSYGQRYYRTLSPSEAIYLQSIVTKYADGCSDEVSPPTFLFFLNLSIWYVHLNKQHVSNSVC